MMYRYEAEHARIERWFRQALAVVDPRASVHRSLTWDGQTLVAGDRQVPVADVARIVVVAIGKAAPAMAQGARDVLGSRIDQGIILTKAGHLDHAVEGFIACEAAHPIPDERGVRATQAIVESVSGLADKDVVLALISGGGSALLEMPHAGIALNDVQHTTRTLMHAGAGIHDLNAVRQVLSQVKGGGLRRFIGPATCVSLLLSDVLGNDPHVIASGPTVPLPSDAPGPREVVERFRVMSALSEPVQAAVRSFSPPTPVIDPRDVVDVIADNETLMREMARIVTDEGFHVDVAWRAFDGDASDLGRLMVTTAMSAPDDVDVLIGGGEATVEVHGSGRGGRNTEAALVAAMTMSPACSWVFASLASDGDDGTSDATGAIADPGSLARARESGVDASQTLATNDSARFFQVTGGLVRTGPTGTNVNDVYIAVRITGESRQE